MDCVANIQWPVKGSARVCIGCYCMNINELTDKFWHCYQLRQFWGVVEVYRKRVINLFLIIVKHFSILIKVAENADPVG